MADQPITSLPVKTSSGMAATDYLLGIDSAEGYQMLIQDLGDYIIQHATSSLAGESQTLASVISGLNSKLGDVSVISGQIVGTSPVTITLPSKGTYLLVTGHVDADVNSLYIINVYTGTYGSRRVTPVIQTQYLRVTAGSDFNIVLETDYTHTINYAFLRLSALM